MINIPIFRQPYDPPADPYKIINSIEVLTENEAESMAEKILGNLPNSYAFTKALAEALVNDACQKDKLPAMILRPSIVIPTFEGKLIQDTFLTLKFLISFRSY